MEIVVQEGSLAQAKTDAIVKTESETSIPVGEAIFIPVEAQPYQGIVHAPMTATPGQPITGENVRKALQAAVICADSYGIKTLAISGMGTGAGGLSPASCADVMIETLRHYESNTVRKIILIDTSPQMTQAFRDALLAERA